MNKRLAAAAALCILTCACRTAPAAKQAENIPPAPQELHTTPIPADVTPTAAKSPVKTPDPVYHQVTAEISAAHPAETRQEETLQISDAPAVKQNTAPALPAELPKDTPVFEDEELIETDGRMLSPYAYLAPDPSAKGGAPWDGEQLKYGLYYSFVRAGTAYIKNRGMAEIGGRPAYVVQTTAFSAAVIDAFFKVRDINQSWIDAQTYYSRGYTQSVREGNYKRDEWVRFAPEEGKYFGKIQKKEALRDIGGELTQDVTDFLSSLYFVRAQELTPGKDIVFDIINREKKYPLVVKVLKKETVKTPAGEFDCIAVEPQLRGEGIFISKGKSLTVWLTDDKYKMPVKMKAEVFIGSVSAQLLEYKRN